MTPLFKKPKYSTIQGTTTKKKEIPDDLWKKCDRCEAMVMKSDLLENLSVCTNCNYHNPLTCTQRLDLISDADSFEEGEGAVEFDSTDGGLFYEVSHPLCSNSSDPEDFCVSSGDSLGFFLRLQMGKGGQGGTIWPALRDYFQITIQ